MLGQAPTHNHAEPIQCVRCPLCSTIAPFSYRLVQLLLAGPILHLQPPVSSIRAVSQCGEKGLHALIWPYYLTVLAGRTTFSTLPNSRTLN